MTHEIMSLPGGFDDKPLPRRNGPKGLLPSTWQGCALNVEYQTGDGHSATMAGATLLEWYPFGLIVSKNGTRTAVSWDRVVLIELSA